MSSGVASLEGVAVGLRAVSDWAYCEQALREVSRTFSKPIELLPPDLRRSVTCAYLLCRIADCVEDDAVIGGRERQALFRSLLDVLEHGERPEIFVAAMDCITGMRPDAELARNLPRVMRVFDGLDATHRQVCASWVGEMVRGMAIYARRLPVDTHRRVLTTFGDLERYCYFVAGTVGHLLTELFVLDLPELGGERRRILRRNAERFGVGLQLVNILKDVTDDWERGWCYVPATLLAEQGLAPNALLEEANRARAHSAAAPLYAHARNCLDDALDYVVALPPDATAIRLFCLLPLWFAVRTLVLAEGNDDVFREGQSVKISRPEVAQLIDWCVQHSGDDEALRAGYGALWQAERSRPLVSVRVTEAG